MANDRILVSTTEMMAAIQRYEPARQTLHDAYNKLDAAKSHLDNCYKGPAYMVLSAKYLDIKANVITADRAIDETVNGLRNTIGTMESTESTVGNQSGSLEVGTSAPTYL